MLFNIIMKRLIPSLIAFLIVPSAFAQSFKTDLPGVYRIDSQDGGCTVTQVGQIGVFTMSAHCLPGSSTGGKIKMTNSKGQEYTLRIDQGSVHPIFKNAMPEWQRSGKSFHEYLQDLARRDQRAADSLVRHDMVVFSADVRYGDFLKFASAERHKHCIDSIPNGSQLVSVGTSSLRGTGQNAYILNNYKVDDFFISRSAINNGDGKLMPGDSGGPVLDKNSQGLGCVVGINTRHSRDNDYFIPLEKHEKFISDSVTNHSIDVCKQLVGDLAKLKFIGGPYSSCEQRQGSLRSTSATM